MDTLREEYEALALDYQMLLVKYKTLEKKLASYGPGIYCWSFQNRRYIGKAEHLNERKENFLRETGYSGKYVNEVRKHSNINDWTYEVLEFDPISLEDAEAQYIIKYNTLNPAYGYNTQLNKRYREAYVRENGGCFKGGQYYPETPDIYPTCYTKVLQNCW